jgi:hypothetical protein
MGCGGRRFKEAARRIGVYYGLGFRWRQLVHAMRFRADLHERENGVGAGLEAKLLLDGLGNAPIAPALAATLTDEIEMRLQLGLKGASGHYFVPPKTCELIPSRVTSDPKLSQDWEFSFAPILVWVGTGLGQCPKFVPSAGTSKRGLDLLRLFSSLNDPTGMAM